MNNPDAQLKLVKVASDIMSKEHLETFKNQLSRVYMEEGEHMFHEMTLEQAPMYA